MINFSCSESEAALTKAGAKKVASEFHACTSFKALLSDALDTLSKSLSVHKIWCSNRDLTQVACSVPSQYLF